MSNGLFVVLICCLCCFVDCQVLSNSQQFAKSFLHKGYQIVSGGTDNHLLLLDLSPSVKTKRKPIKSEPDKK